MQAAMRVAARPLLLGKARMGVLSRRAYCQISTKTGASPPLPTPANLPVVSSPNFHGHGWRAFSRQFGAPLLAGCCLLGGTVALSEGTVEHKAAEEKGAGGGVDEKEAKDALKDDKEDLSNKISALVQQAIHSVRQALVSIREEAGRLWEYGMAAYADKVLELVQQAIRSVSHMGAWWWEHLVRFALQAASTLRGLQQGMSSVAATAEGAPERSEDAAHVQGAEGAEGQEVAKGKERQLRETELAPSIFAVPDSIERYFPVFVFFSIVLGVLTLNLMLRSRDATYAKMGVNQAKTAVRVVSSASHPRRATKGGPLQENEVTTGLVREVLDIVANHPPVIEALGSDVKEGRMNMVRDKKGGVVGSMSLQGPKGEHATVECHAVKDAAEQTLRCTSITVRLPGATEPLSIALATKE